MISTCLASFSCWVCCHGSSAEHPTTGDTLGKPGGEEVHLRTSTPHTSDLGTAERHTEDAMARLRIITALAELPKAVPRTARQVGSDEAAALSSVPFPRHGMGTPAPQGVVYECPVVYCAPDWLAFQSMCGCVGCAKAACGSSLPLLWGLAVKGDTAGAQL